MIMGMSEEQATLFIERMSATAIANQSILKCQMRGWPMTVDNVILCVGDFFSPDEPRFENVMNHITEAIEAVLDCRSPPPPVRLRVQ